MNLPTFTAEQSLGIALGVYINKVTLKEDKRLGVTGMMQQLIQEPQGTCYSSENCNAKESIWTSMDTWEGCCVHGPGKSWKQIGSDDCKKCKADVPMGIGANIF